MGFNYMGNKPNLNQKMTSDNYHYPEGQLDDASEIVPLISDMNNWSVGFKRTMVAHTAYGSLGTASNFNPAPNFEQGGMSARDAGSQGGNFAFKDGHVEWIDIEELDQFANFYRAGDSMGWDMFPEGMFDE